MLINILKFFEYQLFILRGFNLCFNPYIKNVLIREILYIFTNLAYKGIYDRYMLVWFVVL